MKVYLIGSAATGKTTLARYISEKYKLNLLPEVARLVLAEKELQIDSLRSDLDVVDDYQREIFYRQLKEEGQVKTNFVSDRSFDCLSYTAHYSRITNELFKTKELSDYIESLREPDVYIFFVRPSKATLKQDGVRETINWDNIIAIDGSIKMLLEIFGLKYFQISMENMQERIRFIDSILSLKN